QSYINTVNELNQELLAMKEQYEQVEIEKQFLTNQLENQSLIINQEHDTQQIEKPVAVVNEMNHIWKELRNILSLSNEVSLEEIIPYINNLIKENILLKEHNKESLLNKATYSIDDNQLKQDYILLENQYIQLDNANQAWQQFYDNQIDLLKNKFKDYFDFDKNLNFDQIIQIIATKFDEQNYTKTNIPSEITTINNIDFSDKSLVDTQQNNQILSLQEEIKCLEQQLKDNQYLIDSLKNNLQLITQENLQLTKQYNEIQQKNDLLIKDNHNLTNQLENQSIPLDSQQENVLQLSTDQIQHIHHSPIEEIPLNIIPHVQSSNVIQENEEIQQLKNNLATLTTQCTELDEANRAWQQYYQNQIELFHDKLQDWIPLDMNLTLEQIIHQIVSYLNQLEYDKNLSLQNNNPSDSTTTILSLQKQLAKYQNNESILAENLEQLNQKLLDVYKQCEEFREHNAQLILSKQQVDKQLEEQEKQLVEFQLIIKNSEQHLDQQIDLSKENIPVDNINREQDEEINQLRAELSTLTNKCAELDEANHAWQQFQQAQLDNFRN
ncbi:unnamed protein product, partial [Rotaria sordida]